MGIKHRLGKLTLPGTPASYIPGAMADNNVKALPITPAHALGAAALPLHHGDPFDRMLISQSRTEKIRLMSADEIFDRYKVTLMKA